MPEKMVVKQNPRSYFDRRERIATYPMKAAKPMKVVPGWKWGTAEGSREFDRLMDRRLTFREKLEWLEFAETLSLQLAANSAKRKVRTGKKRG